MALLSSRRVELECKRLRNVGHSGGTTHLVLNTIFKKKKDNDEREFLVSLFRRLENSSTCNSRKLFRSGRVQNV